MMVPENEDPLPYMCTPTSHMGFDACDGKSQLAKAVISVPGEITPVVF